MHPAGSSEHGSHWTPGQGPGLRGGAWRAEITHCRLVSDTKQAAYLLPDYKAVTIKFV
jgi:hypothetical protein